ncbi:MAG: hypothetical protein JWO82_2730 [Akkermansiaceae bacterium]|nr:hypothetical protein [Akkermansiaceae bacterium]
MINGFVILDSVTRGFPAGEVPCSLGNLDQPHPRSFSLATPIILRPFPSVIQETLINVTRFLTGVHGFCFLSRQSLIQPR